MSSKFFTWTKGDRKVAHDVLGSRGLECTSPEGTAKEGKKPFMSLFDSPSSPNSKHSSRTTDSFALQDAAVQSATNLIAVMNDVLRSPHLSAHINAQLSASGGRQRSHTAPPTPRFEVPGFIEPAELPGSFPEPLSAPANDRVYGLAVPDVGQGIERPRSSPEEGTHHFQAARRVLVDNTAHSRTPRLLVRNATESGAAASSRRISAQHGAPNREQSLATIETKFERPSIVTVDTQSSQDSNLLSPTAPATASSCQVEQAAPVELAGTPLIQSHQADSEVALIQQIAYIRSSHESHIESLKDAHSKEIETHRTYIEFLEKRRRVSATPVPGDFKGHLSIDTSNSASSRGSDCLSSAEDSSTPATSATSGGSYRGGPQDAIAEVEALKRKLSVLRKTQIDVTELRRERDELKAYAGHSDRRILQLKDIIRKTKDSQRALINANADLEARLQASNVQRVDLLEGLAVASSDVRKLSKTEKLLINELDQLRRRNTNRLPRHLSDSVLSPAAMADNTAASDEGAVAGIPTSSPPKELERLQALLQEKDARIKELESNPPVRTVNPDDASLAEYKSQLATAQADCERYNSLLHNEIRRQSRSAARRSLVSAPEVEAEASAVVAERIKSAKPADSGDASANFKEAIQLLEKELEHCTKEIIMYKLDVRGYKKDLKNAKLEIDGLRALSTSHRPPTPERDSQKSIRKPGRNRSNSTNLDTPPGGLGIHMPRTPARTPSVVPVKHASSVTARSATEPDLLSPKCTTSDVFLKDKALPNLPQASPNPNMPSHLSPDPSSPDYNLQRGETFRSLSESIISSYARRSTSDQNQAWNSPPPSSWSRRGSMTAGSIQNSPLPLLRRRSNAVAT